MSISHCLLCKSLHLLPKFASKTQRIQVGNRQFISFLFIISIIVDIHRHRFEIYTLVLEIHENVDLDEIGTRPNIEVEIDVTDKSPLFIRPYHVKENKKKL